MLGITRMAVKTGIAVAMAVAALAAATTSGDAATGPGAIPASVTWEGTLAHACHILGTDDYGQEAIVCADLNWLEVYNEAEGGVNEFYAQVEVEADRQDSSGFDVQCANIIVEGEFDDGYEASYTIYDSCGHQDGINAATAGSTTTTKMTGFRPPASSSGERRRMSGR